MNMKKLEMIEQGVTELISRLNEANKVIETVAMYARINHDKPKDYGEIVADYISKHMPDSKENKK